MAFEWHVHGLWIAGAVLAFMGALLAGNVEWVEGTTAWSYGLTILLIVILFAVAGAAWISAAVNARRPE
jgi:membrane protein DedA with SNARE-associated domain